jgi:uncharacterized protein YheU (UPF0270 family)
MQEENKEEKPIEVPYDKIPHEVLVSVVESFVLREGTDYGSNEVSLEAKINQVLKQIKKGDVKIFFDASTESLTLLSRFS